MSGFDSESFFKWTPPYMFFEKLPKFSEISEKMLTEGGIFQSLLHLIITLEKQKNQSIKVTNFI